MSGEVDEGALKAKMKALVDEYGVEACRSCLDATPNASDDVIMDQQINQGIFQASFDGILVVDSKGIVQRCNPTALEIFGYDIAEQDLIGQNIAVVIGGDKAARHQRHFDHPPSFQGQAFKKMRDVPAKHRNGKEFRVTVWLSAVNARSSSTTAASEPMYVAFVRDLTEEQHQFQLHQAIIDASFDSIFVCNTHGTIQNVNQAALQEFGYSDRSELIGHPVTKLMPTEYAVKHDTFMKSFRQRSSESPVIGMEGRELSAVRKDGSSFPIKIGIQRVSADYHHEPLLVGFIRNITDEKKAIELAIEKKTAEELLINMLPEEVALRLRENPTHIADHFTSATILFADIVGFTSMSGDMEPIAVVQMLNDLFTRFDDVVEQYGLNKVKTIGDCYMVTSVPGDYDPTLACASVVHFSLDMIDALCQYNLEHPDRPLSVRVGINCGHVVAGVVGTKRFLYDLWGDAVNLASRMGK